MALDKKLKDAQSHFCARLTRFHVNPSSSCWDISLKTANIDLMIEKRFRRSPKSLGSLVQCNTPVVCEGNQSYAKDSHSNAEGVVLN